MPLIDMTGWLFHPGQIVITQGASAAFDEVSEAPGYRGLAHYLNRHMTGDWGEIPGEDKKANNRALTSGERLLSAYYLPDGTKIWIITEWDRSATTILLPEEY